MLAVFVALACAMPELDVVPPLSLATNGAGWLRLKHGAQAAVFAAALAIVAAEAAIAFLEPGRGAARGDGRPCARGMRGGLRVHAPTGLRPARRAFAGRGRRRGRRRRCKRTTKAFEEPVFAAPVAAASGRLVVPRFTEVERRMSARQYISVRIDPILDKISRHGLGSLTDEERRTLENARQKIVRRR